MLGASPIFPPRHFELLLEDQKFVVGGDKLLHFAAYAILGGLMFLAVRLHRPTATAAAALSQCAAVAVMAVISGFLDEISQPLTGRDLDWRDLVADAAGAVAGAVAIALWFSRAASPEDT
ncbi:MAG: VanZ family protein [Planctomycetia bacterium]|nr:VanZ family protein [Planctomycetia bacterium]